MMNLIRRILPVMVVLAFCGAAMACPMCKDSVPNSDAQSAGGVPTALNTSVYLMLGTLFAMLGVVGTVIVKGVRSTNKRM